MVEYQLPKLNTRVRFPSLAPYFRGSFKTIGRPAVLAVLLVCWGTGCAVVQEATECEIPVVQKKGVYHKVQKGETLWRIAKTYQVAIGDIISSNNIPDAALIEENQLVFIPGAEEVREVVPETEDPTQNEFSWPVRGRVLRYYGDRSGSARLRGIRIATQPGQQVKASRQGKVVFADYLTGYDYTVILDHRDGYCSVYGNNADLLVRLGDVVKKGDPIARSEKDGIDGYLYFEIRKDAAADNPLYYLPR